MGTIDKLYIPSQIEVVAIPGNLLSFFISEQNGAKILVIKKTPPFFDSGCGARHWVRLEVIMLPRGGIALPQNGKRTLKYGEIDSNGQIKGYLVFEKIKETCKQEEKGEICEWRITKKDPQAFLMVKHGYKYSRTCSYYYHDIKGDILAYLEGSTGCATMSTATMFLLLPTDRPAIVSYKIHTGEYRGECWDEEVKMKVYWNNGDVKEEEYEEVSQEEVI